MKLIVALAALVLLAASPALAARRLNQVPSPEPGPWLSPDNTYSQCKKGCTTDICPPPGTSPQSYATTICKRLNPGPGPVNDCVTCFGSSPVDYPRSCPSFCSVWCNSNSKDGTGRQIPLGCLIE